MKSFNVLDRSTSIQCDCLLEASAGTGKTFSIENIVVRLILEGDGIPLEQLLVVTFTKAATRDLKLRVRSNIEAALSHLNSKEGIPDYLQAIVEQGEASVHRAKRKLEDALFCFDRAQIFTIHSFCSQMLNDHIFEADYALQVSKDNIQVSDEELLQIIHDFLRTGIRPEIYTPEQVQLVVNSIDKDLEKHLLDYLKKGYLIPQVSQYDPSKYEEIFLKMLGDCQAMVNRYLAEEERMSHDDLLRNMLRAIQNLEFAKKIRLKYRAAIIDEFQDTDPIQWEIFRRLFKEHHKETFLYLVGDPKQSIYAFRQADIYTYLSASQTIAKERHASLDTNYRSQPSLVKALNVLFDTEACPGFMGLPTQASSLEYPHVKASSRTQEKLFADSSNSLHFIIAEGKWNKNGNPPLEQLEKERFFPYMIREMLRLNQSDGIAYKNMAVLIKDRHQADRFARFCKLEGGIPIHLQKRTSLSDSIAFWGMQELLLAMVQRRDLSSMKKALGGHLVGWTFSQVQELQSNSSLLENMMGQCQILRQALLNEGFAPFFQQFLKTTWHSDGHAVEERLLMQIGGEEIYTDLLQIADQLTEYQATTHASPEGLINYLEDLRLLETDEDSPIKRRRDTTRDAVQVLTVHSSKGLEYDIVFALGLVGRPSQSEKFYPKREAGGRQSLQPISSSAPEYHLYLQENDAEKMRQLYVALTRAKYRVYVPVIYCPNTKKSQMTIGSASPMELFLARLGKPLISSAEELYERIAEYKIDSLIEFIEKHASCLSYSILNDKEFDKMILPQSSRPILEPPPKIHVPGKEQTMLSYTLLAKRLEGIRADEVADFSAPYDFQISEKSVHTLPAGVDTGLLLHTLFEKLPLNGSREEIGSLIDPFIRGTEYEKWKEILVQVVFKTGNTPLLYGDQAFCLKDIDPKKTYREMEFLFPCPEGFMKGVIDLIFEYHGKYYIVDWKSNWLGPEDSFYNAAALEKAMEKHHYHLQSQLYEEAVSRFLRLVDKNAKIAGVFYLFVRGCGVHHRRICEP